MSLSYGVQRINVKETEESFNNIFTRVDSFDVLLIEAGKKNKFMVEKKEMIFHQ